MHESSNIWMLWVFICTKVQIFECCELLYSRTFKYLNVVCNYSHDSSHIWTFVNIVYIIKVKTYEDKSYVIKLGQSGKGINARYNEHKSKYDECLLLDCFAINKSKEFESFLHNHKQIRCNRVNNLNGHENELELFLIGKNLTYQILLHIIESNIKNYKNNVINIASDILNSIGLLNIFKIIYISRRPANIQPL